MVMNRNIEKNRVSIIIPTFIWRGVFRERGKKYQIHPVAPYRWKRALEQGARTFLSGKKPKTDPRIKKLEKENKMLKNGNTGKSQRGVNLDQDYPSFS